jgi:hypothetical protein
VRRLTFKPAAGYYKEAGMNSGKSSAVVIGAALILAGIGLLVIQLVEGINEAVILFIIGGVFITGYIFIRTYWMLIPGCILAGIGLGTLGEGLITSFDEIFLVGLGVGFIAIYIIQFIFEGRAFWWPLIPGIILILIGIIESFDDLGRLLALAWPAILVLVGLVILAGALGFGRRRKDRQEVQENEVIEQ